MKKWLLTLLILTLPMTVQVSAAEGWFVTAPTATPRVELRASQEEVKVFANPNMKANIVGYIIPGALQSVEVVAQQGEWYRVRFSSVYGISEGWVPASCFQNEAAPSPLPSGAPVTAQQAFVCNPQEGYRLNLRVARSSASQSLGKYYTGTPLTILDGYDSNGYVMVDIGGRIGYMDSRYLTEEPYSFVSELMEAVITRPQGANLRRGPSSEARITGQYAGGTVVTVLGLTQDGWYHVAVDGQTGFMDGSLTSLRLTWDQMDSDDPAVSDGISTGGVTMYVATSGGSRLNLRERDSASSASLGRFYAGTEVTVLSYTRTGWAYVQIGCMTGYMDMGYLSSVAQASYGETRVIRNGYGTGLNLREMPDTDSAVVEFCPNNTYVTVLGELSDGWCYVAVGEQAGYMLGTRLVRP